MTVGQAVLPIRGIRGSRSPKMNRLRRQDGTRRMGLFNNDLQIFSLDRVEH